MADADRLMQVQPGGEPRGIAVAEDGAEQHHHVTRLDGGAYRLFHQPAGVHADVAGVVFGKH